MRGVAGLRLGVGHVRDVADVGVQGEAGPVGRDRVDPGDALILLQDRQYLLRTRRAVEAEPGVDRPGEVVRVGVSEGECGGGAPGQRYAFEVVEDRAVPGPPERVRDRGQLAVRLLRHHGDLARGHGHGLAVLQVFGRVALDERELERGEPERGRHGVAPRHRLVVPDKDERNAVERSTGDVDLAGDRELRLVEAFRADPREVRIAEQQAAVIPGARGPDRDGIAAELAELCPPRGGERTRGPCRAGRGGRVHGLGRLRRRRLGDSLDDQVAARLQHELVEAQVAVQQRDGLHPGPAAARRVRDALRAADVGKVAVVALDVTGLELLLVRVEAPLEALHDVGVDDLLEVDIGLQVVDDDAVAPLDVAALRPEVPGALRLDRDVVVGHRANVVLGERVAVPEAEVVPVVREDVRDPAGRVADLGGELARGRAVWPRRPAGQGGGSGAAHQSGDRRQNRHCTRAHHGLLVVNRGQDHMVP